MGWQESRTRYLERIQEPQGQFYTPDKDETESSHLQTVRKTMRRLLTALAFASVLSGCASALPTCDGDDRRPINTPARAEVTYQSCGNTA
jgi:hypothetical protein